MAWRVDFFLDAAGKAPVEEFLDSLEPGPRAKALSVIRLLEELGVAIPFPYSSQVEGPIRELRTQFSGRRIRVLYFADSGRVFILLHGFVKTSRGLPESQIRIARARMEFHEMRFRKGKR